MLKKYRQDGVAEVAVDKGDVLRCLKMEGHVEIEDGEGAAGQMEL